MTELKSFIEGMPKVELHIHIEGSLEPEMMFELARRNGIDIPFGSVEEVRQAYDFSNLQDFLDLYYQGMNVLQTEQDFYDLTKAYLTKAASQNVIRTEIFFDPQAHTGRGVAFETVIDGITRAMNDGSRELGIRSGLILCFLRHLSEESAFETLEHALRNRDRLIGIGLDSSELGHPPSKFERVFAKAKQEGFRVVAHAGEEGPPDYVWQALEKLDVDRIDHGNRALEDPSLVREIKARKLGLTVCPLSNLKLCGVADMRDHPLAVMLDAGLKVSVNSDDPAYFGGYMTENLIAVAEALHLEEEDLVRIAANSIESSFMNPWHKDRALEKLQAYVDYTQQPRPRQDNFPQLAR